MYFETYTVRDKDGVMLMEIAGKIAQDMINQFEGEWRTYQEVGGKRTVCYELRRDSVWYSEKHDYAFKMYFWKGTKIIKD